MVACYPHTAAVNKYSIYDATAIHHASNENKEWKYVLYRAQTTVIKALSATLHGSLEALTYIFQNISGQRHPTTKYYERQLCCLH